ncbi:MAG: penicillin-binding transpeptidase domain-containing protein [Bacteroidota bacterium]
MHGQRVKRRTAVIFLVTAACFGILGGRLLFLQILKAPWLQAQAEGQRFHQVPVDAHRGPILDRNGRLLAASVDADCVGANPAEVVDPAATAAILAPILHLEAGDLEARLRLNQSFVWLKRQVRKAEADRVRAKKLAGIVVLPKAQRFYPKYLAGQLLGFAGSDNQGLEGLEIYYDALLRGQRGWDMAEFSALGRHIPGGERRYQEPIDGDTLVLTIDERIQFIAERELDQAVAETGAKRGLVILMDPDGEILAMASRPQFDPNRFLDFPPEVWKNICVTDQYEPGSTFKVVTAAAALEEGVVSTKSTFFDPGYLTVDDRHLHCWYPGGHGSQTFVEAVENSCNPVFASLALSLGAERFQRYIRSFGFGGRTGIDFPGEATGTVPKLTGMKRVELATMGFGQGVSVTPLQLVTAMTAIANGGFLVRPRLMKEIKNREGEVLREGKREVVRQVISRQTADTMRMLLESVVVNGSGNRANIPGYRVAGKTGTAQKPGRGGYGSDVVASFLGFAPADQPRLVGLVVLDEPSCGVRYGGVIAAPVFARIMSSALRILNVPAKVVEAVHEDGSGTVTVPNVINLAPSEGQAILIRAGLVPGLKGQGSFVFDQVPKPGARVPSGTTVLLYFDPAEKYNRFNESPVLVPDLAGLKPIAVEKILIDLGLRLISVGDGVARAQEPRAGTKVNPGTPITVRFLPPEQR